MPTETHSGAVLLRPLVDRLAGATMGQVEARDGGVWLDDRAAREIVEQCDGEAIAELRDELRAVVDKITVFEAVADMDDRSKQIAVASKALSGMTASPEIVEAINALVLVQRWSEDVRRAAQDAGQVANQAYSLADAA